MHKHCVVLGIFILYSLQLMRKNRESLSYILFSGILIISDTVDIVKSPFLGNSSMFYLFLLSSFFYVLFCLNVCLQKALIWFTIYFGPYLLIGTSIVTHKTVVLLSACIHLHLSAKLILFTYLNMQNA